MFERVYLDMNFRPYSQWCGDKTERWLFSLCCVKAWLFVSSHTQAKR